MGEPAAAARSRGKRVDEEVARMRVGMHEVVDEDLFQVGVVQLPRQLRTADAGGVDGGKVVDLDAGHVFQGQHAAGGVLPENIRDVDAGIVREVGGKTVSVVPFGDEIQLGAGGGRELGVELIQVDAACDRAIPLQPAQCQPDRRQVGGNQPLDSGALHLDHHLRPVHQTGAMHLGERRRGLRHRLEAGEDLLHRPPELGGDQGPDVGQRLRRHLVLQPLQLIGDRGWQDIHARAEELPQLDQDAALRHGEPAEAFRPRLPARQCVALGGAAQARHVAQNQIPPDRGEEHAGEEPRHAQVAPGVHPHGRQVVPNAGREYFRQIRRVGGLLRRT